MHLCHDSTNNTLRLVLTDEPAPGSATVREVDGIIDVGERGQLVGIELRTGHVDIASRLGDQIASQYMSADRGSLYIDLMDDTGDNVRSAEVRLMAEFDAADDLAVIVIPRRGSGYEITYPSGNR